MSLSTSESRMGIPKVQHENGWPIKSLRDNLKEAGAAESMISRLVDSEGKWTLQPNRADLYNLADDQRLQVAGDELADFYYCGQLSIVEAYWGLFNAHTWEDHVVHVAQQAARIGAEAGLSYDKKVNIQIAAAGHDLGILQRRKNHSLISPRLFARIFPRVVDNTSRWSEIESAMVLHDESVYKSMGLAGKSFQTRMDILSSFGATDQSAALVIADKLDVGRRRVWETACNQRGMNEHPHSVINTALQIENYGLDPNTGQFRIPLKFDPFIHDDEAEKFREILTTPEENGYRYYVPSAFRENEQDILSHISFDKTCNQFFKLYGPSKQRTATSRLELTVDNIYLLNPGVDEVSIEFQNSQNNGERRELLFTRETVDQVWNYVANFTT